MASGSQSPPANGAADDSLLIQKVDCKRLVTLNRPKQLNALNMQMIRNLYPRLQEWESDPDVKMVIVKGAGDKAFCAGGDVLAVTKSAKDGKSTVHKDFFYEEYKLNYLIGTYGLPYIAIIDGITMGGGCGLSVHGKFRVATERTLLAMPETALGLFPDVGGSYFLPRLAGRLGMFLALTGYRLKGADVFHAGIATHFVSSDKLSAMESALLKVRSEDATDSQIDRLLGEFQRQSPTLPPFSLEPHISQINSLFDGSSVEEIIEKLKTDGSDWALKQVALLGKMSPTSLKITFRQLTQGARLSFKDVFTMEYRLTQRCVQDNDLFEGCRAILVDKDNKPQWSPSSLVGVSDEKLDWYFSPLPDGQDLILMLFCSDMPDERINESINGLVKRNNEPKTHFYSRGTPILEQLSDIISSD